MDLYCPICGEPWDFECLHEEAQARYAVPYYLVDTSQDYWLSDYERRKEKNPAWDENEYQKVYKTVTAEFRQKGCKALQIAYGRQDSCKPHKNDDVDSTFGLTRSEAAGALYDILGDDMDGAAAMLDDMGF